MSDDSAHPDTFELQARLLEARANLYDPETGLPTLPVVMDAVRKSLDERSAVQVLVIRIEQEQSLEAVVGWERYDGLLRTVADYLKDAVDATVGVRSVLCQDQVRGDRFFIFSADRRQTGRLLDLLSGPITVSDEEGADSWTLNLRVGMGDIQLRPAQRLERCIYAGVSAAVEDFNRRGEELDQARVRALQQTLRERQIKTLFQPIYRLPQRKLVGFEALSRGPEGTYLEPAENLFGFALRSGMLGELEQLCVERALASAHRLPIGSTLFINLSFRGLEHLEAGQGGLANLVRQAGWSPREFVLEITEHTYAEDPGGIANRVWKLREQGFRVAIDDMGTGFSSLNTLAELRPDYIKLDHMLVRDLATAPIKRNLVSAITGFARTSQSLVIAEGVERQDEVTALQELGVSLLQGFFLGRPKEW